MTFLSLKYGGIPLSLSGGVPDPLFEDTPRKKGHNSKTALLNMRTKGMQMGGSGLTAAGEIGDSGPVIESPLSLPRNEGMR